jgi:multidrug efflux pump subunit AcrA (membrane-fusion protein)
MRTKTWCCVPRFDRGYLRQARGDLDQIPVEMSTSSGSTVKGHIRLIDSQVNGQSGTIRVRAVFPTTKTAA